MEREVREAIRASAPMVGFWDRGQDGGYRIDEARADAAARGLGTVGNEWLAFYQDNLVTGGARFVVASATIGASKLRLTVRNAGAPAGSRIQGPVDLGPLR
jgi:hypothetical protein